jgi:hypothetical protein
VVHELQNAQNYSVGTGILVGQEFSVGVLSCEVPKESVLGPLLFISYIDDISRVIRYCRFHIYADDLQIYHTCAVSDFQRCTY